MNEVLVFVTACPALRIQAIEHPRVRNRFPHVFEFADPGDDAFDAHTESAVRHRAVTAQIEVPLERFLRQIVLLDALQQQIQIGQTFDIWSFRTQYAF